MMNEAESVLACHDLHENEQVQRPNVNTIDSTNCLHLINNLWTSVKVYIQVVKVSQAARCKLVCVLVCC
jgi:hypothetical protein